MCMLTDALQILATNGATGHRYDGDVVRQWFVYQLQTGVTGFEAPVASYPEATRRSKGWTETAVAVADPATSAARDVALLIGVPTPWEFDFQAADFRIIQPVVETQSRSGEVQEESEGLLEALRSRYEGRFEATSPERLAKGGKTEVGRGGIQVISLGEGKAVLAPRSPDVLAAAVEEWAPMAAAKLRKYMPYFKEYRDIVRPLVFLFEAKQAAKIDSFVVDAPTRFPDFLFFPALEAHGEELRLDAQQAINHFLTVHHPLLRGGHVLDNLQKYGWPQDVLKLMSTPMKPFLAKSGFNATLTSNGDLWLPVDKLLSVTSFTLTLLNSFERYVRS